MYFDVEDDETFITLDAEDVFLAMNGEEKKEMLSLLLFDGVGNTLGEQMFQEALSKINSSFHRLSPEEVEAIETIAKRL